MFGRLILEKHYPPLVSVLTDQFLYFFRDLDIPHRTQGKYERKNQQCRQYDIHNYVC